MTVAKNIYVGKRYVPKQCGDWDSSKVTDYESLSVVLWGGASYTSKQDVPKGIDISNSLYWVKSADYNAQVAIYEQNVRDYRQYVLDEIEIIQSDNQTFQDSLNSSNQSFQDGISSQLTDMEKYRRTISISTEEFEDGVRTDLEILQATHDYIVSIGKGNMSFHRDFTITDSFYWNVTRVNITGNGRTVTANINDLTKYAIELTSEPLFEYVSPQNNIVFCGGGFHLTGRVLDELGNEISTRTCLGIRLEGTDTNNISNVVFSNITARHFHKALIFGSNAYMITFISCVISFNKYNIFTDGANVNMGENISFIACQLTGTQSISDSYCIYNNSSTTMSLFFTNCSLDWHRRLFYTNGTIVFNTCWIESPQYALDNNNYYGELTYQGYVHFIGGNVLLNHDNSNSNPIDFIFKFNHSYCNVTVDGTKWLSGDYKYIANGNGILKFNIKSPTGTLTDMNYFLSNSVRHNAVLDNKFSFSSFSFKDKWSADDGTVPLVKLSTDTDMMSNVLGKKCIAIRNLTNVPTINVSLKLPVKKIDTFYKYNFLYYFMNTTTQASPSSINLVFYTRDDVVVQTHNPSISFSDSIATWQSCDVSRQMTETLYNNDIVDYVVINFTVSNLSNGEIFYLTEANFQSF